MFGLDLKKTMKKHQGDVDCARLPLSCVLLTPVVESEANQINFVNNKRIINYKYFHYFHFYFHFSVYRIIFFTIFFSKKS